MKFQLKKKTLAIALAVALFATTVAGCSGGTSSSTGEESSKVSSSVTEQSSEGENSEVEPVASYKGTNKDKTLIRTWGGFPTVAQWTGNPNGGGGIGEAGSFVFEGLFQFSRSTDKIYPRLAQEFKQEGDKVTVTIRDAKFNDGTQFTSKDVWSFYMLNYNARITKYLDSVEIPDEKTVIFDFAEPVPIDEVKMCMIAENAQGSHPYHLYGKFADQMWEIIKNCPKTKEGETRGPFGFDISAKQKELTDIWNEYIKVVPPNKKPVGTGPYVVGNMNDNKMILEKNPLYYDADKIEFETIQNVKVTPEQGVSMLKKADTDSYPGSLPLDIATSVLASNKDIVFYPTYDPASHGFYFYQASKNAPLNEKKFRQALVHIINKTPAREAGNYYGIESNISSLGIPPSSLETYVSPEVIEKMREYDVNPTKAEELLKEIGCVKDGTTWKDKNGKELKIVLGVNAAWQPAGVVANVASIVSDQLNAFGIKSEVKAVDGQVFSTKAIAGEFDMIFEWTDVSWAFMYPYFPLQNYYDNDTLNDYTAINVDKKKRIDVELEDWDGNKFDVYDTIDSLVTETDAAKRQVAIDRLVWAANENAYSITLYQNVTGVWENRAHTANLPYIEKADEYKQWMPLPETDEEKEAYAKLNWGFAGIQKLVGENKLSPNTPE